MYSLSVHVVIVLREKPATITATGTNHNLNLARSGQDSNLSSLINRSIYTSRSRHGTQLPPDLLNHGKITQSSESISV